MKPSILRNLLIGCVSFGLIMGAVFPFFADLFVEWKDGMFGWFVASCLVAGVACGSAIYWLVHVVLLKRLKRISEIANAISQNDISHVCEMQSDDMIGDIVGAFNHMAANLRTMVVDIQEVYDEYTDGEPYPWALQLFAQSSQNWKTKPRYFVIFGDGSFDYRDINGTGYNFVSPQMFGSSNGIYASDTLLGDLNGDGRPEVAFGRIPVKSVTEGLAYLAKLQAYEAGIGELPSLLVADKGDKGGDFSCSTYRVQQEVPGLVHNLDLKTTDIDTARAESMDDAVVRAASMARPGDTVLLAPACSSFDMFRSYAERGDVFQRSVRTLGGKS